MNTPYLTIDLAKIEHNARAIVGLCNQYGIQVTGVTKATCGHPGVARAMLRGGVISIADSRIENIQRLRAAGVDADFVHHRVDRWWPRVDHRRVQVHAALGYGRAADVAELGLYDPSTRHRRRPDRHGVT